MFQYGCTIIHDTNIQWTLLYMTEVYSAVSRYNMTLKTLVSVYIFTVCSIPMYNQSWNYHNNRKTIRALHWYDETKDFNIIKTASPHFYLTYVFSRINGWYSSVCLRRNSLWQLSWLETCCCCYNGNKIFCFIIPVLHSDD